MKAISTKKKQYLRSPFWRLKKNTNREALNLRQSYLEVVLLRNSSQDARGERLRETTIADSFRTATSI